MLAILPACCFAFTEHGKCNSAREMLGSIGFLHIEAHGGGVATAILKTPVGCNSGKASTGNPTPLNFSDDISVVLRWKCPSGNLIE